MRDWVVSTETGDRAELAFEPSASLWAELSVGRRSLPGEALRARADVLLGAGASGGGRGGARDREPRALPRRRRAARSKRTAPGSSPSTTPSSSTRRTGSRRRRQPGSEAGSRWDGCACSRATRSVPAASRGPGRRSGRSRTSIGWARSFSASSSLRRGRVRLTAARSRRFWTRSWRSRPLSTSSVAGLRRDLRRRGRRRRRALVVAEDLDACLTLDDPERVSWAEPGAVAWAPVDVSEILRDELWERPVTAVLVSATLEPTLVRPAPWARGGSSSSRSPRRTTTGSQALLYVPVGLPEPRAPGADDRVADEVEALCRLSRGRALVLTTSYRALDALVERVAPRLPYPVLCQGDAPRERLLERFRDEVESVLFATSTFWQGIDVSGESLSLRRHRQASVLGARRSARRGPVRAHRPRGRRLVRRVRASDRGPPASPGVRPPDPSPRGSRRGRDPRSPHPHAGLRKALPRSAAVVPGRLRSLGGRGLLLGGAPCDRLSRARLLLAFRLPQWPRNPRAGRRRHPVRSSPRNVAPMRRAATAAGGCTSSLGARSSCWSWRVWLATSSAAETELQEALAAAGCTREQFSSQGQEPRPGASGGLRVQLHARHERSASTAAARPASGASTTNRCRRRRSSTTSSTAA